MKTALIILIIAHFCFAGRCQVNIDKSVPDKTGDSINVADTRFQLIKSVRKLKEKYPAEKKDNLNIALDSLQTLSFQMIKKLNSPSVKVSQEYLYSVSADIEMLKNALSVDDSASLRNIEDVIEDFSFKLAFNDSSMAVKTYLFEKVKVKFVTVKCENQKPVNMKCRVYANSWGHRESPRGYFDLGYANTGEVYELVAGIYDIWVEEPPDTTKLPKTRNKKVILFTQDNKPLTVPVY